MKNLLLGMGNPILSDDAVGVRLARDFKKKLQPSTDIDVVEECSVGGLNLLDLFSGYDRIIVVDSFKSTAGVPGDWYYFTAPALRGSTHLTNIHDTNFATALALGHKMGMALPPDEEIHIFAVEIKDNLTFSEHMTAEVEKSYPDYASGIFDGIQTLLQGRPLRFEDRP